MSEQREERLTLGERVRLGWWKAEAWLHRCSECGHRPDGHKHWMPRWEDDQTAQMLGIGQYGCRRCGHGAIEQRDAGCDHSRCCRYHGTHSNPHRGCILR